MAHVSLVVAVRETKVAVAAVDKQEEGQVVDKEDGGQARDGDDDDPDDDEEEEEKEEKEKAAFIVGKGKVNLKQRTRLPIRGLPAL